MKRQAEEYITKEHGSTPNTDDDPSGKPKMATPAQRANRQIKQPKSRLNRSTTPTTTSTFGSQSQTFQFGNTTQSFPPPTQSQAFNFAPSTTSFTFGQNGASQLPSNPFANANGTNGGIAQEENAMMDDSSPQKKPALGGGLFNFGSSTQPAPTTNGFGFGQPAQTPPTNVFGGGSLFGQPQTQEQKPATSLFGTQPQTNGFTPSFGQSTQTAPSVTSAAPFSFGQPATSNAPAFTGFATTTSTSTADSTPAFTPTFRFGSTSTTENKQSSPQPESATSTTPKAKPAFSFGQTPSFGKPDETAAPASEPPKFTSFGQKPVSSSTENQPTTTPSKTPFSFGQSAASPQPEPASAPAKPFFSYAQTGNPSPAPASSNIFNFGNNTSEAASSKSPFGGVSPAAEVEDKEQTPAEEESDQVKNPFSSLFGKKAETGPAPAKPQFNFGEPASPAPSATQSSSVSATADKEGGTPISKSPFQFPTPNASSGGLFSPKPAPAPQKSQNLFNLNKATPPANSGQPETSSKPPQSSTLGFGSQSNINASAGSTPFKAFSQPPQKRDTSFDADENPPAKKRLFATPTAADTMERSASAAEANPISAPGESLQPKFTQPQKPAQVQEPITRAVSTEGPPQIPRYLSADKYKSYDENWRLKALNRHFQKFLTSLDADRHDFISAVQNYLDHRESIGEGLTQYIRKQAPGSKRKASDVDDMQTDDAQSKRAKPVQQATAAVTQAKPAPTTSNIFGSVPSPKPAAASSPSKPSNSATSNLFKSMIPGATSASASTNANSSGSVFGSAVTKSTTPPSSPPKPAAPQLPKFEVPKFSGAGTNFANAFAANAAANVSKFEKEAKEKRKAEDFDSDEDDEAEWEKQYEQEQRMKKARLEAAAKGAPLFSFVPSASSTRSNSPFAFTPAIQPTSAVASAQPSIGDSKEAITSIESDGDMGNVSASNETGQDSGNSGDDEETEQEGEDDLPEDQEEEEEEEAEEIPDLPKEQSLFSRIQKVPSAQEKNENEPIMGSAAKPYYKPAVMFDNVGKESPQQPDYSPFTPRGDFVPTTSFNFTSNSSGPTLGSSLKDGPIRGEGLFGSRPSTPQPMTNEKTPTSTIKDNTWTKGSPIKFGTSMSAADNAAPSIEVSAATPPQEKKPNFFGAASSTGSLGFQFGSKGPGLLGVTSAGTSGFSSRGSSPGLLSEAESVNTDVSTAQDEEHSNQPQLSLMQSTAGEENEDVLFETRANLSRIFKADEIAKTKYTVGWNKVGVGLFKLLKNKQDGKCRLLFRAEPNATILLNTRLIPSFKYTAAVSGTQGAVSFAVAADGKIHQYMLKVKTKEMANEVSSIMEANKNN